MYCFNFFMPTKVLFGAGQLKNLHLEKMPGKKALIVTSNGQSTKNTAICQQWSMNLNKQAWSMYFSMGYGLIQPVIM